MRVTRPRRHKSYTRKKSRQQVSDIKPIEPISEQKVGFFASLISVLSRFFK